MAKKGTGKFILGALVGAGLGLLFAPKSGKETRKALVNKADELIQKVKDKFTAYKYKELNNNNVTLSAGIAQKDKGRPWRRKRRV